MEAAVREKNCGNELFRSGFITEALACYTQAATGAYSSPEVASTCWSNAAQCNLHLKRYTNALGCAMSAITFDCTNVKALYRAAEATLALSPKVDPVQLAVLLAKLDDIILNASLEEVSSASKELLAQQRSKLVACRLVPSADIGPGSWKRHAILPDTIDKGWAKGSIFSHSIDGVDENLLVLMHGLGDTNDNFIKFGMKLQLPQTALLSLQAPNTVPLLGGGMWFPSFTDSGDQLSASKQLPHVQTLVHAAIRSLTAIVALGWPSAHIHVVGFGDGGTVALHLAHTLLQSEVQLVRSVVSFGGLLLSPTAPFPHPAAAAPFSILAVNGTDDDPVALASTEAHFSMLFSPSTAPKACPPDEGGSSKDSSGVTSLRWPGRSRLPSSVSEARPLMQHFSQVLSRRLVALESDPTMVQVK